MIKNFRLDIIRFLVLSNTPPLRFLFFLVVILVPAIVRHEVKYYVPERRNHRSRQGRPPNVSFDLIFFFWFRRKVIGRVFLSSLENLSYLAEIRKGLFIARAIM